MQYLIRQLTINFAFMEITKKILCVDDDVEDLSFPSDVISDIHPEYEIVQLQNGIEAINYLSTAKANKQLPNLVLLDINMPFLDGKETLEKIRTDLELENLPVIIFTASRNPNDIALFKSKGVEMYTKPSEYSTLQNLVKKLLLQCAQVMLFPAQ